MSKVVKKVGKEIGRAFKDVRDMSLDLVGLGKPDEPVQIAAPESPDLVGLTASEQETIAGEEAKRKAKKSGQGTESVLTSPLGGGTVNTATKKLGG